MRRTDTIRYDATQWDVAAREVLHPSGRPKHEKGLLLRNRRTGLYSWLGLGGALRSVDQAAAVGIMLRSFREAHGLTQTGLAGALGLSDPDRGGQVTVARWETGKHPPPPYLWRALAQLGTELAG